ncbi:MAG: hypothetical protein KDG89_04615 [Geminicoccaceae bacterium]|nr:hypothetical protein [Geminicoccaceae bacterium]
MSEAYAFSPYPIAILIGTVVLGALLVYGVVQRNRRKKRGEASRRE